MEDGDRAAREADKTELTETRFPCQKCGALLTFAVGTSDLECRYCGHRNEIAVSGEPIKEYDLHETLDALDHKQPLAATQTVIQCPNCAAQFELDEHVHAQECPFCGTAVVTGTDNVNAIKPRSLLPFKISDKQAKEYYRGWLKGLWFAPSELKKYARDDTPLNGVYIPYWTYDSDTVTAFSGMRGDTYYERGYATVIHHGRTMRRSVNVPKIRWTPVNGRTQRHFDDVLIGATRTLPRKLTDWLGPWDLQSLVPYKEDYLSGFRSEIYQVELDEGFNMAQQIMNNIIRSDVRFKIGGDQQRISHLHTDHHDTTFKHLLLPLWSAAFQFRGKTYRFVVNGRTGKTKGERPYSITKIALAIIAAILIAAGLTMMARESGMSVEMHAPTPIPRYEHYYQF